MSVAALAEDMAGMAPLWGGKLDSFGDELSPCLQYIDAVASIVKWGCANVSTLLAMEVPRAPLLQGLVDEDFRPCRGHGIPVEVKCPL